MPQQGSGLWRVISEVAVDLTLSVLPNELTDNAGNAVPLIYGNSSFGATCLEPKGQILADPSVGISDCRPLTGGPVGLANVFLGTSTETSSESVLVDLSEAPPGTYTAVIELTATVH